MRNNVDFSEPFNYINYLAEILTSADRFSREYLSMSFVKICVLQRQWVAAIHSSRSCPSHFESEADKVHEQKRGVSIYPGENKISAR